MTIGIEKVQASEVSVEVSEAAKQHFQKCLAKESATFGVRLFLKKSGCSGLAYVLEFVNNPVEGDILVPLVDGYQLCIDKKSFPFLKGTAIDYVREGLNYKLTYQNPNQTGECGCGESFTIDEGFATAER